MLLGDTGFDLLEHALDQMKLREIREEDVIAVLQAATPFRYYQEGFEHEGYYNELTRLFVGTVDRQVVTVFRSRASYVAGLKRRMS